MKPFRHLLQPEGSSLCGQTCIVMAAGVSLERAIEAVGHEKLRGTCTREVIAALRSFGINCAGRCRPVSRHVPVLPKRGIVAIRRDKDKATHPEKRRHHWMLTWDGTIYDPGNQWPNYEGWRITSVLEIYS